MTSPLSRIPAGTERLLDVGCNVGALLGHARSLGVSELYGIEINAEAAATAQRSLGTGARIMHGSADYIPIGDDSVDAVTCCEVLEHMPAGLRPAAALEMHRVLKPGGVLVLTVPYRGAFAFLDPANARYSVPAGYRLLSRLFGGRGREAGFEGEKHGVVWHHHFTLRELDALFAAGFRRREIRYRGCFLVPAIEWMLFPFYRLGLCEHPSFRFAKWLQDLEMRWSPGRLLAYNVLCVLEKAAPVSQEPRP